MTCCNNGFDKNGFRKNAFRFFLLGSAFFSCASIAVADCTQPAVIDAKTLVAPSTFVDAMDQVTHPDAGRIASYAAAVINKKQTDASIDAQVGYIRCLSDAGTHKQIIASITGDGAVLLQHTTAPTPEKDVAAN